MLGSCAVLTAAILTTSVAADPLTERIPADAMVVYIGQPADQAPDTQPAAAAGSLSAWA